LLGETFTIITVVVVFYHCPLTPDNGKNAISKITVLQKLFLFLASVMQDITRFLLQYVATSIPVRDSSPIWGIKRTGNVFISCEFWGFCGTVTKDSDCDTVLAGKQYQILQRNVGFHLPTATA